MPRRNLRSASLTGNIDVGSGAGSRYFLKASGASKLKMLLSNIINPVIIRQISFSFHTEIPSTADPKQMPTQVQLRFFALDREGNRVVSPGFLDLTASGGSGFTSVTNSVYEVYNVTLQNNGIIDLKTTPIYGLELSSFFAEFPVDFTASGPYEFRLLFYFQDVEKL